LKQIETLLKEKEKNRAIFPGEILPDQAFLPYLFPLYQLEHLRFSERNSGIVTRHQTCQLPLRQKSRKAQVFSTHRELTQGT
jgi:hypothetical protein